MELFNSFSKIVLVIEYDGRCYYGFQWQPNQPTIQAELEAAIQKLTGETLRVIAASRTDAGVHARGQVASFRTRSSLSPQTFVRALNFYLPVDISVKAACRASMDFDVRRHALSREYDYSILNSPTRSPLDRGFSYLVAPELDVEAMNGACRLLEGEHDFASFAASLGKWRSTRRNVFGAKVVRKERMVIFHMEANSFLPHQVRNTVGLLMRVGLRKLSLEEFRNILEARIVGLAGPTALACGLCLTKINYPRGLGLEI